MTTTDYLTRYRGIRDALDRLDPALLDAAVGVDLLDQLRAASRDTQAMLERAGRLEHSLDPSRFGAEPFYSDNPAARDDVTARVLAAVDVSWRWCAHLRRTPAQPTFVLLAVRRVDCPRCACTVRNPPAAEGNRCDLCGTRGHIKFWPVRFALSNWLVLGDMCRDCADAIHAQLEWPA